MKENILGGKSGGTTALPNALFDALLPTLGDTELRVLLVVARSTLGWKQGTGRKERDWLSHRQLQKRTGRSGAPVSRAIDSLVRRGLLLVQNEAGQEQTSAAGRRAARSNLFFCLSERVLGDSVILPYPSIAQTYSKETFNGGQREETLRPTTPLESKGGSKKGLASPVLSASETDGEPATSERPLHFLKTTKETRTKNRKKESSLLSQVKHEESEVAASEQARGDQKSQEAAGQFLALFTEAHTIARPGEQVTATNEEEMALLCDYFQRGYGQTLVTWLPAYFRCSFGFVRRRHYSVSAYLDCFFILQAQGSL